ncbi:hypothetical protein EJB05_03441, partial [Eragrostis curvula]
MRRANHGLAVEASSQEVLDLISGLPDGILGTIVSLLGTEEGARTAALARRWRHVWRSAPLNLDDRLQFTYGDCRLIPVISKILAAHRGPARRIVFRSIRLSGNSSTFDTWFQLPLLDALQELVLHFHLDPGNPELPASALRFTSSLRVLDIRSCKFPGAGCSSLAFPCLIHLTLCDVGIAEDLLQEIISNSPGIETMMLDTNFGHRRLRISLPKLRCLAVAVRLIQRREDEVELDDLVVEGAVSLERLLLDQITYGPSVRITGATKLKMIGYMGTGFPAIVLDNSIFKAMVPLNFVQQLSTVRVLALTMTQPDLRIVIDYLRCFPCVEILHIKFENIWMIIEGVGHCERLSTVDCLDRSLKTVVLQPYDGLSSLIEFAKFFVERAMVLECMKFCRLKKCNTKWIEDQRRELNIENKASRHAEFLFVRDNDSSAFWMDEAFGVDDPF